MTRVEKAYSEKWSQGLNLADAVEQAIAEHKGRRKQINWEHVGDLEHVNAKLTEILEFLERSRIAEKLEKTR